MSPVLSNLNVSQIGSDITVPSGATTAIASQGLTSGSLTTPSSGLPATSADAVLISGYTANPVDSEQVLVLSSLTVDSNAGRSVSLKIRPVDDYAYAADTSANTTTFALRTDSDRDTHVFSSTTLGSKGLRLQGSVSAYVKDARTYLTSTPHAISGGNPTIGGTLVSNSVPLSSSVMSPSNNYGSWDVQTTIQAVGSDFDAFTLKAGSTAPSDSALIDIVTGQYIVFSGSSLVVSGELLNDFVVDPTKHSIIAQIVTEDVYFSPQSRIPEGTSTTLVPNNLLLGDGSTAGRGYYVYNYGAYPSYEILLSPGSVVESPVEIFDLCSLPGGQVIPTGSSVTNSAPHTTPIVLPHLVCGEGFILPPNTILSNVVPTNEYFTVPSGMTSTMIQALPLGSKTSSDLSLSKLRVLAGTSLESQLTLRQSQVVDVGVDVAPDSTLKAGSTLAQLSSSIAGSVLTADVTIPASTSVTDRLDISTPVSITADPTHQVALTTGTVLKGPFTLPSGTSLPQGSVLPSALKLTSGSSAVFAAGATMPVGTSFGTGATLSGDVSFSPKSKIPAVSTLSGNWTFPAKTKLTSGLSLPSPVPVPSNTKFVAGSVFPTGLSMKEGASLPTVESILDYCAAAAAVDVPLRKTADEAYVIIGRNTTFMPGFQFPVGTIMSALLSGNTVTLSDATTTGGLNAAPDAKVTLAAGSYSLDEGNHNPAQDDFDFVVGVATSVPVTLSADAAFNYEFLIPASEVHGNLGSVISFNTPLTLLQAITLTEDYTVVGANNVTWPANTPLPVDFILGSSLAVNFSTPTVITKDIVLNVLTQSDFVSGIMASSPAATWKLPPAGYTLDKPIKLGVQQTTGSSGGGSTTFGSFVQLPAGAALNTMSAYTLTSSLVFNSNFSLVGTITLSSNLSLSNGIILLAGSTTPAAITIAHGSPMPSGLTLAAAATLAADVVVGSDGYYLASGSTLASGSVLAKETAFPLATVLSSVTLAPIQSLSSHGYVIEDGENLSASVQLPYLMSSGQINKLHVNNSSLISSLVSQITALQAAQAGLA